MMKKVTALEFARDPVKDVAVVLFTVVKPFTPLDTSEVEPPEALFPIPDLSGQLVILEPVSVEASSHRTQPAPERRGDVTGAGPYENVSVIGISI
jgi:hypothetical protein